MPPRLVFIQETHLLPSEIAQIRRRWPGQVFSSHFSTHAKGVATLIHKSLPMCIKKHLRPHREIHHYTMLSDEPRLNFR